MVQKDFNLFGRLVGGEDAWREVNAHCVRQGGLVAKVSITELVREPIKRFGGLDTKASKEDCSLFGKLGFNLRPFSGCAVWVCFSRSAAVSPW